MIFLGLIDSKPSSAAILEDGRVVAAVAEERLCRMKMASGMPLASISEVLRVSGVRVDQIDHVAVAQRVSVFEPEPIPWQGWFDGDYKTSRFDQVSASLAPWLGRIPLSWKAHHQLKRYLSRERVRAIPPLLKEKFGIHAPVRFYDHHYCHATSAYYTSAFDRALVVTLDGGGDGLSGSVYVGVDGRLKKLSDVDSFNSLGNFYSYITEICGFKAEKHEGKITGLAALGKPIYLDILRQFVRYEHPGRIRYGVPMYYRSATRIITEKLPAQFEIADLAASVQQLLEEVGTAFMEYWVAQTGMTSVAVAGGVFANVKFNQRVHEIEGVSRFYVHPAMDDSGLSVGSALAAAVDHAAMDLTDLNRPLSDVYFGPAYSEAEVRDEIEKAGLSAHAVRSDQVQEDIAALLADGYVVSRFTGRMEYGPRALGNRTILYQTTDPSVNDWLNENLDRTEFMPFAPATLLAYAQDCYEGLAGAEYPARFMTITFNCTEKMKKESPGVVHVDGTARPQLIDENTAPDFYRILQAYHRLTGIPSLINTSFNMHGEPIVCSPADALRSFRQGNLDYLAIENYLVRHPDARPRRAAGGRAQ